MPATIAGAHLGADIHANRPAANAAGQPFGALYSCTTHNLVYRTDGSTWSTWATLGGTAVDDATISTTDITTNNASTSKHGWLRKLDNNAAHYLDGTGAWTTPGGGGGSGGFPLDNRTLHATYGDHFTADVLDTGKWTRVNVGSHTEDLTIDSHLRTMPYAATDWGYRQAFTDKNEFDIILAGSYFANGGDEGFGPFVTNSSDTGLFLAFRNTSRLGLFALTAGASGAEPVSDLDYDGTKYMGLGRKVWWRIIKRKTNGVDIYWFAFSFDGASWTRFLPGYDPSDFTPARIGFMHGVQGSTIEEYATIDYFDVVGDLNIGNDLMTTPSSGTATASSDAASQSAAASVVIDGNWGNEWYFPNSNSAGVYWQVSFSVAQSVNRIRFRSRADGFGAGWLETQSGATFPFYIPNGPGVQYYFLDFPTESTNLLKFYWAKQGHGANPGFQEIAAHLAS